MAIISDYNEAHEKQQQQPENPTSQTLEKTPAPSELKQVVEKAEEEQKERLVPNESNGLDMENYSWGQTLQELTVTVSVPPGTISRFVVCEIKRDNIKIGLKNQQPIIEGELFKPIKPQDCFWSLEDQKTISVLLTKQDQMDWWKSLIKGGPEIDTHKVEPPPSRLSELDGETRASVEKMMFDQRQKSMGLPSSTQIEEEELLKKLKAKFPDMDFSGKNFGQNLNFQKS